MADFLSNSEALMARDEIATLDFTQMREETINNYLALLHAPEHKEFGRFWKLLCADRANIWFSMPGVRFASREPPREAPATGPAAATSVTRSPPSLWTLAADEVRRQMHQKSVYEACKKMVDFETDDFHVSRHNFEAFQTRNESEDEFYQRFLVIIRTRAKRK